MSELTSRIKNIGQRILQGAKNIPTALRQRYLNFKAKHPRLTLAVWISAGLFLLSVLFVFCYCLLIYKGVFGKLPNYAELKGIQHYNTSEVYSGDGVLLGKYYVENRINADFEEISPNIIDALVATEDARFFDHQGVDYRAWMRVLVKTILLFDQSSGGGSTLSQQLAKNLYPRQDYRFLATPTNKIREMFIARRLENIYDKNELLRLYLNTVPFSENIYGIKVASQRFFNQSPKDLKVEEAAVLVGMLKATTSYNPLRHPERSLLRRNTVLNQMEKYGRLSEEENDSLKQIPINLSYYTEGNNTGLATYFREHLRQELDKVLADYVKPDGTRYNLYTDGLKIYTTINASMQQYAEEAVQEHMPKLQKDFYKNWGKRSPWGSDKMLERAVKNTERYQSLAAKGLSKAEIDTIFNRPVGMQIFSWEKGEVYKKMSPLDSVKHYLTLLNVGFLAVEPDSGLVKAWVGGIDHKYFQYDHVKAKRQVGSTFKPIVFAKALQAGMLPCEYTENELVTYDSYDNWQPRNSDGQYGGVYSMEGALSRSVNSVTVGIMMRTGIDSVKQLAEDLGIQSPIPSLPAISLGAVDASLLDMIRVYSTFANRGLTPKLHYLDRIETSDGEVLIEFERPDPRKFERVLAREHADVMNKMLESVVDSGTARRLRYKYRLHNDIAGKTGTTQNHTDGWFIGYTPKIVAGVWVGADNPAVHFRTMGMGQGSSTALPVWGKFMQKVYLDEEFKKSKWAKFAPPPDTLMAMMQCPPYLEQMPIIAEYYDDYYNYEREGFFNKFFSEGGNPIDEKYKDLPRPRNGESRQDYEKRAQAHLDKQERKSSRRDKRKEFFSKLFFSKEKKKSKN